MKLSENQLNPRNEALKMVACILNVEQGGSRMDTRIAHNDLERVKGEYRKAS